MAARVPPVTIMNPLVTTNYRFLFIFNVFIIYVLFHIDATSYDAKINCSNHQGANISCLQARMCLAIRNPCSKF